MNKEILIKNGWVYGKPINDEHNKQARRIFTLLNGFGIHYGDFNLKEGDTDRSLLHFIKNDKIYIIHSNKIFNIKGEFCYYDDESDYSKIELVSDNLEDIIRLELITGPLLREKKINDILNY